MQSDAIVLAQPCFDDDLRLTSGGERPVVEQFGAQCTVERSLHLFSQALPGKRLLAIAERGEPSLDRS